MLITQKAIKNREKTAETLNQIRLKCLHILHFNAFQGFKTDFYIQFYPIFAVQI